VKKNPTLKKSHIHGAAVGAGCVSDAL